MSYTYWSCREHFSTLQIQKMHQTLETYLSELISASVPLSNKISGIVIPNIPNKPSTLTVVGGETVNSGESTDLLDGNSYDIKTDQERFPNYQSYGTIKHNDWNNEASQFKLTENYTVDRTADPYRDANFLSLNYSKVEDRLEGYLIDQKGYFEFQDPWFVKSDGSQPGNYWRPCLSYYEPTGKEGAVEKGVFLNQPYTGNNPVYYKIKLPQPVQDIYLQQTNKTHRFYFQGWNYDPNKISLQYPTSIQTGVVFKEEDAVLTANLKGTQLSNSQSAYTSGSQRKIIRVVNYGVPATLHAVYESNGYCWYEMSTDNGQTWQIMNDGKPLSFSGYCDVGKCPSIEYSPSQNFIYIVWQGKQPNLNYIKIMFASFAPFPYNSTNYELQNLDIIAPEFNYSYESLDANPVLAIGPGNYGVVVWKGTYNDNNLNLKYKLGLITDTFNPQSAGVIPETDSYSSNPSIFGNKSWGIGDIFHLAYQKSNEIYYRKITRNGSQVDFNDFIKLSENNGFGKNYNPSVTGCFEGNNSYPKISWIAFRKTYIPDNPQGGGQQSLGETKVFCRSKNAIGWSAFSSYGSNINVVNINHNNDNTFAIAWSEALTSNYVNKFVRSDYPTEIYLANTSGKNLQVINYDNLNNMRLNSFTTSTTPYSFSLSNTFYVIPHDIQYYMDGNIVQDTTTFYFRLGDILVDGQQVKFEDLPDGINIPDYETLNSYFVSRPFSLTDNIDFIYSVEYGVTDSLSVAMALQDGKFAHFKVELIDDQSNELLGIFDDVTYNSENIMLYEKIAYQVNTQGIGNRICRLRLVTEDDLGLHYSISNCYKDQTDLAKLNLVQRIIDGINVIKTYALDQNFPNPFNPTTVIKYQIPKSGNVVLKVYDILGSELVTLEDEQKSEGRYEVNFDASNLASGVYIYRLSVNDFVNVKKMILLK